jgi:hypothetical protein
MHARKLIIARVEELNKVCPGNALVWEFVQLKDLERSELANRLDIMFSRQRECSCDPDYIEKVHKDGYDAVYRRKIVELYLEVSAHKHPFLRACYFTSNPTIAAFLVSSFADLLCYVAQLNLASETIALAVNLLDRYLALGSKRVPEVKMIAVAALVIASKMHGRTLSAKQLIAPGATHFSARDVMKMEFVICSALKWELTPVTPYEIMKYVLLYSAADGETLKNLVLFAQHFIDYALCEYAVMKYSQRSIAMAAVLQAHKAVKHCPDQWLEAIKEAGLHPTGDAEVHACCYAMERVFDATGIGIPPRPIAVAPTPTRTRQVSPTSVACFSPGMQASVSPEGVQEKRKRPAASATVPGKDCAPVKFRCAPKADGPALKRPRALSIVESPAN